MSNSTVVKAQAQHTSRSVLDALFGVVSTAANTVTSVLSTVDTTVNMATTSVDDAARRQHARSKIDEVTYKRTLVTQKTMEVELQKEQALEWCDEVVGRADRFADTYDELMKALN